MNEGENHTIMKLNIQLLKLIGLHVTFDNNIVVKPSMIRVGFCVSIIASIVIFQFWSVCNKSTVLEASNYLAMAASTFCFLGKYILTYHNRTALSNLMTSLQYEYEQMYRAGDANVRRILTVADKKGQAFTTVYFVLMMVTYFIYCWIPLLWQLFRYFILGYEKIGSLVLPFQADFIFDISEGYPNVIAFIVQVLITKFMTFICTGVDCIFMTIALHIAAQFSVVGSEIQKIGLNKSDEKTLVKMSKLKRDINQKNFNDQNKNDDLFNNQGETSSKINLRYLKEEEDKALSILTDCVKRHITATEYVNTMDKIFSSQVFIHFSTKSFSLCFSLFQATLTYKDPQKLALSVSFFISNVVQLYMFSFYGQEIISKSEGVAEAAYDCLWYNFGTKFRKTLYLLIMRSQKPLALTGAGFYTISIQSFSSVMSATYSYFTLLQTIKDKS